MLIFEIIIIKNIIIFSMITFVKFKKKTKFEYIKIKYINILYSFIDGGRY